MHFQMMCMFFVVVYDAFGVFRLSILKTNSWSVLTLSYQLLTSSYQFSPVLTSSYHFLTTQWLFENNDTYKFQQTTAW